MLLLVLYQFPPYQTPSIICCYSHIFIHIIFKLYIMVNKVIINNIVSTCVELLLNNIKHPELLQEWKIDSDAVADEK